MDTTTMKIPLKSDLPKFGYEAPLTSMILRVQSDEPSSVYELKFLFRNRFDYEFRKLPLKFSQYVFIFFRANRRRSVNQLTAGFNQANGAFQ